MLQWCMAHPWMTFFIILGLIDGISYCIKYLSGYKDKEAKEGDNND